MGGIDWDDYHFLKEHGVFELNLKIQEQTYENILSAMKRDESNVSLTAYMRGLFDDTWEPSYVVSNSTKEFPGYLEQFDGLENTVAIILPWLELFIGIGIILGIYINANALLSGSLLILFNILVFLFKTIPIENVGSLIIDS